MGTWGAGVFENDAAADFRSDIDGMDPDEAIGALIEEITNFGDDYDVEEIDMIVAGVAMLDERLKKAKKKVPNSLDVAEMKATCLEIFDRDFDQLEPAEGFKDERRKVIVETFDSLAKLA